MADKIKDGQSPDQGETVSPKSLKEQSKLGATLRAATLGVLLSTSVQASDLLKQCDFNKNGQIDTPQIYGLKTRAEYASADQKIKDIITKEKKCETDFSIAQKDASIAQKDASIAQKDASIAQKDASIAQKDASIAQKELNIKKLDEDYSKMVQILAMLDPKEARKYLQVEIKKVETELKTEKDEKKRKKLTDRLETLNSRLKELDKNVA